MYYLYIIYSEFLDKYYIGSSGNINDRIKKHNSNHKGFTGKANDWKVVYKETFDNKCHAIRREKQIKKWKSRKRITALIEGSEHPD